MPRPAPRARTLLPAGLVLLLLAAPFAGVERAAAQGNATQPAPAPPSAPVQVPFEPQPQELRDTARGWLDRLDGHMRDVRAAHPGRNTSFADNFYLGAWDFLNESRIILMQTQLYQGETQLQLDAWFPDIPEDQRRAVVIQRTDAELNTSRAQMDAFWARLAGAEGKLRTTHGLEYALLAAKMGVLGESLLRRAPNVTSQLPKADVVEERITLLCLLFTYGPQVFAQEANDVLDLAQRVDAQPGRPALPPGALDAGVQAVRNRLDNDPEASSTTGSGSNDARLLMLAADTGGPRVLYLERFLSFQEARAADAVDFRKTHGTMGEQQVATNLRAVLDNASLEARYDGNVQRAEADALARARGAGYQAVLQVDARNQALYSMFFYANGRASATEVAGGWDVMVGVPYASWVERTMGAPQAQDSGSLLLYGGIAVAAALAVAAFVVLRKPGA